MDKSGITKSEMFGEILTHPTDKQLVKTSQNVELSKNILREKAHWSQEGWKLEEWWRAYPGDKITEKHKDALWDGDPTLKRNKLKFYDKQKFCDPQ